MNQQWKDKTAIITGGAGGLGLALSRRLLREGVTVALLDNRREHLDRAASEAGDGVHPYQVDVTDDTRVRSVVDDFASAVSRIDILVNCAGVTGETNIKSHEISPEELERVFSINVTGCLTTFRAAVPHMLPRRYGRILHVASMAGKEGNAGMLAYSTAKGGVIAMTKVQGKEYAGTGILVNALAPAVIRTEIVDHLPEEQVRYMTEKIPMGRCGTLDEFAAVAAFIVSEENSFTTGFTFDLSGGRAVY